jgi:uncharacterized protein
MATALVTGGNSGIGAQFARTLASRGWDLVLVGRDADRLEGMRRELSQVDVETLVADLASRDDVARVAERLESTTAPIELLVNNAGFGIHGSLLSHDLGAVDQAWEVMMRAVMALGGAAGRAMRARGHGRIITVSSVAGLFSFGAYSATKSFVTTWSESLSNELHGTGVHVTAACPGWVHTEFHRRAGIRASSIPGFLWVSPATVVDVALRDSERGKAVSVATLRFKIIVWLASRAVSSSRSDSPSDTNAHA